MRPYNVINPGADSALAVNQVLRKTYFLLSLTLLFSGAIAAVAIVKNVGMINHFVVIIGWFGLYFLTLALRNSPMGILAVFAFTGFIGFTLGPILNTFIHGFTNGPQLIAASLGSTGIIFMALSGYVLTTKKDFSFMGGLLFVAILVAILALTGGAFFNIPLLYIAISAAFVLIASGLILFDTSRIIHGGEQNYLMATIQLYIDLYILFINLLQILSIFGGRRD